MVEMIVGQCDSQHNGSLILLSYLGHTIFSSNTLPDMFTLLLLRVSPTFVFAQISVLQNGRDDGK